MRALIFLIAFLAGCGGTLDPVRDLRFRLIGRIPTRTRERTSGVVPSPNGLTAQAISEPGAPQNLVVKYDPSVQVQRITWTAPTGEQPAGYQLYLFYQGSEVIRDIQYPGDNGDPGYATLGLPGVGWAFAMTAYVLGDCGQGKTLPDGSPICEGPASNVAFSTI